MKTGSWRLASPDYLKVRRCCQQALDNGFNWIWIDTCCIDKMSSAELSEAINSIYQWYQKAFMCYVYLVDFEVDSPASIPFEDQIKASRWFTRGWIL
jgi:hypothetical protein